MSNWRENPGARANVASAISHVITAIAITIGDPNAKKLASLRDEVTLIVEEAMDTLRPDYGDWSFVKEESESYTAYLAARRRSGALVPFDLVRPGLSRANFEKETDYWDHMQRIAAENSRAAEAGSLGMKPCSECGVPKPKRAFKNGGVCNSCRTKKYRKRVAAREQGEGQSEDQS